MILDWLILSEEVTIALRERRTVVALESTIIAHGLPWPTNFETAKQAENAIRYEGAVPATIAIWHGQPTIGLSTGQIEELAKSDGVMKASRRDLGAVVWLKKLAATTVSATMALAHMAGISVFATGVCVFPLEGFDRLGVGPDRKLGGFDGGKNSAISLSIVVSRLLSGSYSRWNSVIRCAAKRRRIIPETTCVIMRVRNSRMRTFGLSCG